MGQRLAQARGIPFMTEQEQSQEFHDTLNESARLLSQNRPGEAVQKLEPLSAQAPDNPDVAINLSGAYILQRKWDKAVNVLSKAVEAHPDNAMLWANLGAAQLGRLEVAGPKQQEKAMEAYYQALRADPYAPNVHYHLGLIYKERDELIRAAAMFQRALEVNPTDKDAQYWSQRLTVVGLEDEDAQSDDVPTDLTTDARSNDTNVDNVNADNAGGKNGT
jgi:tetratricopeptide (TPR) repeat protein